MKTLTLNDVRLHFEFAGEPIHDIHQELRWRLYQWKKLGLAYFSDSVNALYESGELDVCFLFYRPNVVRPSFGFSPEPFPILASVYETVYHRHRIDQVEFLSVLAYHKLAHEAGRGDVDFEDDDQYGLYCAFIDRFYANTAPYRGNKVYWILFEQNGVNFFSREFDLDPRQLMKFSVGYRPVQKRPPPGPYS